MCLMGKRRSSGMSLVELMVAIAITSLLMTLSISIFVSQNQSYRGGKEKAEIHETAEQSLMILSKDVAQSGWSVKPEMAFYVQDGGDNASDEIYINDTSIIDFVAPPCSSQSSLESCKDVPGCRWVPSSSTGSRCEWIELDLLTSNVCPGGALITGGSGSDSITLDRLDIDGEDDNASSGSGVDFKATQRVISNAASGATKIAKINADGINTNTNTLALETALSGNFVAPAVYYCVEDSNLRRSDYSTGGDKYPLAANIVDLQVGYLKDGAWYFSGDCNPPDEDFDDNRTIFHNTEEIELICLTVVAKSEVREGPSKNDPRFCRPKAGNRDKADVGSDECGFVYRKLSIAVQPRNRNTTY